MNFLKKLLKFVLVSSCSYLFYYFIIYFFSPIIKSESIIFPYAIHPFDLCIRIPKVWLYIKMLFKISLAFNCFVINNSFFSYFPHNKNKIRNNSKLNNINKLKNKKNELCILVGKNLNNYPIYINEKGLFQNLLVTGTIGSGKTSSVMYPACKQLIQYSKDNIFQKIGMLILDVKGNFYKQVLAYAQLANRLDDVVVIELDGKYKYNPLHKPELSPQVLANRLKTILLLFSPNNSESYWLDETEKVISESIKLCRLYNHGYVTFKELHKLITRDNYYVEKLEILKTFFRSGKLSKNQIYDLHSSLLFFENEFLKLDSRVLSILKSEITRITSSFVSNYNVLNTFSPNENELNFLGFKDIINNGKIVVLNMNISEYENLSKIIAAYLKLDFQSEVLMQLSKKDKIKTTAFICDEYHEYVTATDSNFFAQSREAKCINIVATQSYSSILNTLKDSYTVKVVTQNLINKLWFRTDDLLTIEEAQKQIGKEEKHFKSTSISENARETNYNHFTSSLLSKNSSISESINESVSFDFIYDTNFFTQELETFSCLSFISNGNKILPPEKIKTFPCFKKNK